VNIKIDQEGRAGSSSVMHVILGTLAPVIVLPMLGMRTTTQTPSPGTRLMVEDRSQAVARPPPKEPTLRPHSLRHWSSPGPSRYAARLGLAVGAVAAATAISLAVASPATAATSASVANDTLTVTGTNGNDQIALRLAPGNPGIVQVVFDGTGDGSFDRTTFSKIVVLLGNGDDRFDIDSPTTALVGEQVTVNGGNGDDILNGGAGAEQFIGGNGKDAVDGNGGSDTADLGSGTDSFTWDPGDGSDVIDGGTGTDTLVFNGANVNEQMSLSPNGERSLFHRVQGNINMDMIRVERLDLRALGGADTVTINDMSGTDFRQADVALGGADAAIDTVIVNGTENADHIKVKTHGTRVDVEGLQTETRLTGTETSDVLRINARGGDEKVDVDPGVSDLIGVQVDLGAGQF
jgi:Ca2+-binding RTX toxin-like protein